MKNKIATDSKTRKENLDTHATYIVIAARERVVKVYYDKPPYSGIGGEA